MLKPIKKQLGCRYFFFLMQLYYPGKLVKTKYRIGTRYRQILNIKWLELGLKKKPDIPTHPYFQCIDSGPTHNSSSSFSPFLRLLANLVSNVDHCSEQNYVISFVVPNQKKLTELAKQRGIVATWEELCTHPDMEREVLREIKEVASSSKSWSFVFMMLW